MNVSLITIIIIGIILCVLLYLLKNNNKLSEHFEGKREKDKEDDDNGGFFSSIKSKFGKDEDDDNPVIEDDPDGSKLLKKLNEDKKNLMRPAFCKQPASGLTLGLGCITLQDSTDCHNWTSNFNKICRKKFNQDKKNLNPGVKPHTSSLPSQNVYGEVIKYEGGCKINPLGAIPVLGELLNVAEQKGRAVCGIGWEGGSKLLPNSTKCICSDEGSVDTHCNKDYGEGKGIGPGYSADKQTGAKKKYKSGCPTNERGCEWFKKAMIGSGVVSVIPGPTMIAGRVGMLGTIAAAEAKKPKRAQCELGWHNGAKLRKNSTQCHAWNQLPWPYFKGDNSCRKIFNNKNLKDNLLSLKKIRDPIYKKISNYIIDVSGKEKGQIINEIQKII